MVRYKNTFNVCFATEDFYPNFIGGQGVWGHHLVKELARLGRSVTVLAEKRAGREEILLVPFCFGNQLLLALFEYLFFQLRLRHNQFDILHANQLTGLFFVFLKPINIKKVVISVHNTNQDMARHTDSLLKKLLYQPLIWLERVMYQRADGLLFNSPDEEKRFCADFQIKRQPVASVYPGVEPIRFTAQEKSRARKDVRRRLGLSPNTAIVLFVGRLVGRKKVDTLVSALTILRRKHAAVAGVIIGEGRDRPRLQRMALPNVLFLGFVSDTTPYFLAADLFVLTSVAEGGFSLSVVEAANFGLPLIVSPSVAGFPIVIQGVNGYIVGSNDPVTLARRVEDILPRAKPMGQASRSLSLKFRWPRTARQVAGFYEKVLQ